MSTEQQTTAIMGSDLADRGTDALYRDRGECFIEEFEPIDVEPETEVEVLIDDEKLEKEQYEPQCFKPVTKVALIRRAPHRPNATTKRAEGLFGLIAKTERVLTEVSNSLKQLEDEAYKTNGTKAAHITQARWMVDDLVKSFRL
jgi:hypothetical protein